MALLLTESDVESLLRIEDVIASVEAAFAAHGRGAAENLPRSRIQRPDLTLHVMSAALPPAGVIGLKAYAAGRRGARRSRQARRSCGPP